MDKQLKDWTEQTLQELVLACETGAPLGEDSRSPTSAEAVRDLAREIYIDPKSTNIGTERYVG